uniref:Uncharacterized 12.3 kDa protein in petA-petD intergenic region n=1 Tax=Chlamydomonas reinhardtii TaxID=3055 RepID=YCX6_CHLRE|nr:RecName: Full=Uncharacterized 12.3 kDa protein in petA-petD intergenic region; AltName: Full=ORF102 [Chlamydomonas reinhardtii]CAA55012.1 unnamed protein product [Chlamydomonas reinhardtii]
MTLALMQSMGKLKFLHCLLPLPFRDVPFPLRASKLRDFNAINKFVPLRDVSGSCEVLILYINIECLHTPKEDVSGSGTATAILILRRSSGGPTATKIYLPEDVLPTAEANEF